MTPKTIYVITRTTPRDSTDGDFVVASYADQATAFYMLGELQLYMEDAETEYYNEIHDMYPEENNWEVRKQLTMDLMKKYGLDTRDTTLWPDWHNFSDVSHYEIHEVDFYG